MQPEVVAHRGASAHRAEHTLEAYQLAIEQRADGLECDVRLTRDGHLVCVHDRRIDRTSSGRGVVSTLSLDRLNQLDYRGWHAGEREPGQAGVLTLDALLGMIADTRDVRLFVETKHPVRYGSLVEAKLIARLAHFGLAAPLSKDNSKIMMMSFSPRAVQRVRQYAPKLPTVQLVGAMSPTRIVAPPADYLGPGIGLLRRDPDYVAKCKRPVYCWTVDEPADVQLCHDLGVRYLATNKPAVARQVLHGTVARRPFTT